MSLKLRQYDNRLWIVSEGKNLVAEIYLDYCDQVDEVVLHADSSDEIQLQVLRLAASHARQFVKDRRVPGIGGPLAADCGCSLTAFDSYRLMDFERITEQIQQLDRETLMKDLHSFQIGVTVAVHATVDEAIKDAIRQVGVPNLRYNLIPRRMLFSNEIALRFAVAKPERFIFWNSQTVPTGGCCDLHIVPSYHPVMNGKKAVGIVNGDTDAYISDRVVHDIYCPKAARANRHYSGIGSSWGRVKHPFYAVGRSMSISLSMTKVRSKEGVEKLAELLRASLGKGEQYVAIIGGFRAPMDSPHNRLVKLRRRSPFPEASYSRTGNLARGSEAHCVWAYRTLKAEGVLDKSHIPSWFLEEDWLGIYGEQAEV